MQLSGDDRPRSCRYCQGALRYGMTLWNVFTMWVAEASHRLRCVWLSRQFERSVKNCRCGNENSERAARLSTNGGRLVFMAQPVCG
ncbi:hypothetical protein KCP74_09855 [Salmonella enterica subsp. enterica]|nr:hypothetical protein KCP74_09855 [Salmonella enterica subsp. enterica]